MPSFSDGIARGLEGVGSLDRGDLTTGRKSDGDRLIARNESL